MMRQYELVERVTKYDPTADEALLNRAYVYAMKAHGNQKRASGDPYISHPLEVAAILTDLKLDDATIAAALLHDVIEDTDVTRAEIDQKFGKEIGALATPDKLQFAPGLPKTRSGKIMRRILRKIAEDDPSNLGDISTLADPAVVDDLVTNRQNRRVPA